MERHVPGVTLTIVGIPGSLAEASATRQAVELALQGAASRGAETRILDLRDYDLPLVGRPPTDDVDRLKQQVRQADGIILGTPEYHGGYSGVLKTALDLMGFDEFQGKMVGLVAVSGGALGGTGPLLSLRNVCRTVHAWVVPNQAGIPFARKAFEDGIDEATTRRIMAVGDQVAKFAALHRSPEAREFLKAWEQAYENPGA